MTRVYISLILLSLLYGCSSITDFMTLDKDDSNTSAQSKKISTTEAKEAPVAEPVKVQKVVKKPLWDKKLPQNQVVSNYCKKIEKKFRHWGWGYSRCMNIKWNNVRKSHLGDPLIWTVYGSEELQKSSNPKDMTLILCGVHGDEITPIKFCFDIIHHLEKVVNGHLPGHEELEDKLVVVAPIVTPDSFFKRRPTRTNARGVDVNRNFPTKDWNRDALRLWKTRYRSDKRRYPGERPLSEQETIFQVNLIKRYNPSKIITVHAPLSILDYDGPEFHSHNHDGAQIVVPNAQELLIQMSKMANGYKIKNYPFFPGSLGNYAGNERNIPTYTLELPTSDNRKHKKYWATFKDAIHSAILHDMKKEVEVATLPDEDDVSTN
ncbi:putative lipoprotein [Halobacteriovorax marinus SJ]|uniref:Lipoprotein n=1 Tax=Halobacteriovorax marinus (strain ATCC BAA-682 / DSM 15412 / SJ) TaxID=862908 RepID=E1X3L3_HALMS|nr:putative lipoprotein [Halobacteriovorax marinus SJ]